MCFGLATRFEWKPEHLTDKAKKNAKPVCGMQRKKPAREKKKKKKKKKKKMKCFMYLFEDPYKF